PSAYFCVICGQNQPFLSHSSHSSHPSHSATHCPPRPCERKPFHPSKFTLKIHHFGSKNALPSKLFSLLQTGKKGGGAIVTESLQGFCWGPKPLFTPSFRLHRAKGSFSAHAIIPHDC